MCWDIHFPDKTAKTRDELVAIIGRDNIVLDASMPWLAWDHCLCAVNVEASLQTAGYDSRPASAQEGTPGDTVATPQGD